MDLQELIDKAKEKAGIETDYALAKALATSRSKVSAWRLNVNAPDAESALKLAALAEAEPLQALAACELARRQKTPESVAFWQRVANGGNWRKR